MARARLTPLERALRDKLEDEWREEVIDAAHRFGWAVAYFRPARTVDGQWRTPVGADGKGWLDLTLVRDRVLFVELKRETGVLEDEQRDWIRRLDDAGAEWYVWRPSQMDEVIDVLRRRRGAAS